MTPLDWAIGAVAALIPISAIVWIIRSELAFRRKQERERLQNSIRKLERELFGDDQEAPLGRPWPIRGIPADGDDRWIYR